MASCLAPLDRYVSPNWRTNNYHYDEDDDDYDDDEDEDDDDEDEDQDFKDYNDAGDKGNNDDIMRMYDDMLLITGGQAIIITMIMMILMIYIFRKDSICSKNLGHSNIQMCVYMESG